MTKTITPRDFARREIRDIGEDRSTRNNEEETGKAEAFYRKRKEWLDYLCERDDITHGAFRVGYFIARKINADDQRMWWSVKKIAVTIGVSTATVSSATAMLQDAGLLVCVRPARGINSYSIRMPYDPEGQLRRKRKPRTQKLR
ncbi:helix-turn-helix domain-containing protein [Ensifer canadensis]|uniref:helix-turn-helix domain-containing protein n=1 Tax=Ensifer canadensis TaxID=555315 RepID=UPI0035E3D46B